MAKIQSLKSQDQSKPKAKAFLCCFGFSGKVISEEKAPKMIRSENRKKTRFFSWSRFRGKDNHGIKTVPVDGTVPEKPQKDPSKPKLLKQSESKSKLFRKSQRRSTTAEIEVVPPPAPDPSPNEKPLENTNLENPKHSGQVHSSKNETCRQRLSFSRKIDSIRNGSSQPGSPIKQSKTRTVPAVIRQQSGPFVAPNREIRVSSKNPTRGSESRTVRRFDSAVGLSVILVTLVIMVFWGRICAILCTSAWLYFVPRLSSAIRPEGEGHNGSGLSNLDMGSEEYLKKKVVLEGFLERNHRGSL